MFRRELGSAYIIALCLLLGVELLWYGSVTRLEGTVRSVASSQLTRARIGERAVPVDSLAMVAANRAGGKASVAVARTVAVTSIVFVVACGIAGLAVFRTEREMDRRRDAERRALEARDEAERMSHAKSEFLTHVSHELRTPLNSVIGFSNVLLRRATARSDGPDIEYVTYIRDNGAHLLSLIDDLLDLGRIEAGRQEAEIGVVQLDRLIRELVAQLEGRIIGKDVVLRAELPDAIAPLATDERKLKQVLINLVGNAIKFTPAGSVTVRVDVDPETADAVRIEVSDTGIGIPQSRQGAIFEAFEQADGSTARLYEGTGLGLAIARAYCELLGYHLSVESEVGVGSTFRIDLPATTRPRRSPFEAPAREVSA